MRRLQKTLALALVGATMILGACQSEYDGVAIHRVGGHSGAEATNRIIAVPEGGLVVFHAEVQAKPLGDDYGALDNVRFESQDLSVARVVQGLRVNTWMVLGNGEGQTELNLWLNSDLKDSIIVEIGAQEDQP